MLRKISRLYDYEVRAKDGDVGTVHDVYFDDAEWSVRYLVVNAGTWLAGRRVLVSPVAMGTPHWEQEIVPVDLTQDQVKNSPPIDLDKPVSRQQLIDLHEYYGWPATWAGSTLLGTATVGPYPAVLAGAEAIEEEVESEEGLSEKYRGDPHLRSAREVLGYSVEAEDGDAGHIDDLFVDTADWVISYMQVDTGNWLFGRKVLLATMWIEDISWPKSKVHVDVTRQKIENSPEYDPGEHVTREYEVELYGHYEVRPPWK